MDIHKLSSTSDKHLLVSGCSFTAPNHGWAYEISEQLDINVHNHAQFAAGNELIARRFQYGLFNLIHERKVKPSDIVALIMWSSPDRTELFVSPSETDKYEKYLPLKDGDPLWSPTHDSFAELNTSPVWIKSGGGIGRFWKKRGNYSFKAFRQYYEFFHTREFGFYKTLERIFSIQNLLKAHNIPYKMMSWQNIFNQAPLLENKKVRSGVFSWLGSPYLSGEKKEEFYRLSKDIPLLKDLYPSTQHLWDMIDWDRWWFFEDEVTTKGGFGEWCVRNTDEYKDEQFLCHPTAECHRLFSLEVATPITQELLNHGIQKQQV